MSVRLSACSQLENRQTDITEIIYWGIPQTFVDTALLRLKSKESGGKWRESENAFMHVLIDAKKIFEEK